MAVRCSAERIADFVVLVGMTGTFTEYCECADDARELKSLDLIISTIDVFVEAFCFSFEDIYRSYKENFPLSKEKFIEFLKPRCLLLTKDNSCFNFILVCAFVHDIIHSFSDYNKCFHLVKVASKCLAAILKNRFKKIFETDSAWEELISFCIKIHDLVYPETINEYDDDQLLGLLTGKMEASFFNMALGLGESSFEKYTTNDNDDDSDTETICKKSSPSSQNYLTTQIEIEESDDLSISKFPTSSAPQTLQLSGEVSSFKLGNKEEIVDSNKATNDNEKVCVKHLSLPNFTNDFTNAVNGKMSIRENVIENLEENLNGSTEGALTIKTKAECLDLSNWELPSTDTIHILQLKCKDPCPKEAENENKTWDENDTRKNNRNDYLTGMTDSLVSNLEERLRNISIDNEDDCNENIGQMNEFKKQLIHSYEKESALKAVQGMSHLSNLKLDSSTGASHTYHTSGADFSPNSKSEDSKKIFDEIGAKKENKNVAYPLALESAHQLTEISVQKKEFNKTFKGAENPGHMNSFKKNASFPLSKDLNAQNAHNLESAALTDPRPTIQLEDEISLKNDLEDNEKPFDIRCMSANKVRARITHSPQHLLEIMNLLKKCEEDIEPNLFSSDEYDILINDTVENEEMEAGYGTSKSCNSVKNILEAIVFYQNVIMTNSIKNIYLEHNLSDDESPPKTSGNEPLHEMNEIAYDYGNRMLESDDPRCSLCAGGMDTFLDACVYNFSIKYSNNDDVSDLFRIDLQEDFE